MPRINNSPTELRRSTTVIPFSTRQHLIESFPGRSLSRAMMSPGSFGPPYVLENMDKPADEAATKSHRRNGARCGTALIAEIETHEGVHVHPA